MISAEQFAEWKEHPVTKEIYQSLGVIRSELTNQLAVGNTIGYDAQETHGSTNRIVGQIAGLDQILDVAYNDSESDDTSGKSRY